MSNENAQDTSPHRPSEEVEHGQDSLRLVCYPTVTPSFVIRPAPLERPWMNSFPDHFAYRCLPMNMANMHAWEILCPTRVEVEWNGGLHKTDLYVRSADPGFAISHFGNGILTFTVGYLLRTIPKHNLFVTGPINLAKDAIAPLTAIIEADWSPYSFTMNWMLTRCNAPVVFEKNEPFCAFFPVPRGLIEATEPEIQHLHSDVQLEEKYMEWCWSRRQFLDRLEVPGTQEQKMKWQKQYFRGLNPDRSNGVCKHQTTLKLKSVVDRRNTHKSV